MSGQKPEESVLIGMDIGGTKTAVLVVDHRLKELGQVTRPTDVGDPLQLLDGIVQTVREALARAGRARAPIAALGVAVPGLVDPGQGLVKIAVNLDLESYPLAPALSVELNAPVYLENDVRTAAMGAYQYISARKSVRHLAYLSIGTGIAAGVILDGRLFRGANGMAGEIGHVVFEPDGPLCGCGTHGCLEAVAAGPAVARLAQRLAAVRPDESTPGSLLDYSARSVYLAAQNGDPLAIEIVGRVSAYYARAIQLLIMSYDVDKVVLGGGVTRAGAAFLEPVLTSLAELRAGSLLGQTMLDDHKISLLPPDYNAGSWGAASFARQVAEGTLSQSGR